MRAFVRLWLWLEGACIHSAHYVEISTERESSLHILLQLHSCFYKKHHSFYKKHHIDAHWYIKSELSQQRRAHRSIIPTATFPIICFHH